MDERPPLSAPPPRVACKDPECQAIYQALHDAGLTWRGQWFWCHDHDPSWRQPYSPAAAA